MDNVDQRTRSRIMSSVGQRNTGPEMRLRRTLHRAGVRYRLHDRKLPGSPDLVLRRFNAVIFVHGCFWHNHKGCKFSTKPSSRKEFWRQKFEANKRRDARNCEALLTQGWRVLIVWECAIKSRKNELLEELGVKIIEWLKSNNSFTEMPVADFNGEMISGVNSDSPNNRSQ